MADIADDSATTSEDTAVTTLVLANDSFENAGRALTAVTQGAYGTVAILDASHRHGELHPERQLQRHRHATPTPSPPAA